MAEREDRRGDDGDDLASEHMADHVDARNRDRSRDDGAQDPGAVVLTEDGHDECVIA
jgi:hypothetical protein